MAAEVTIGDDILRLNALIDGELSPAEHAAVAARLATDRDLARAYASLARLKACVVEIADREVAPALPARAARPRRTRRAAWAAAAAALLVVAGLAATIDVAQHRQPAVAAGPAPVILLASLAGRPAIPDLSAAGLRLASLTVEPGDGQPRAVATYQGPRGCRLELRVEPGAPAADRRDGPAVRVWTAGDAVYRLDAHGMPAGRFAAIADAAERATAGTAIPVPLADRLREARLAAPPCVG